MGYGQEVIGKEKMGKEGFKELKVWQKAKDLEHKCKLPVK
jgi:hypothetical protein